ncbi:hypothetical protein CEXT_362351 [Caerostris extrusa]|uniref:Par3/HAL N-terminal domain-containing protein n=1 Tax=Caerostris extrusa TaxID=172846 RepID=A0AAV4WVE0_CAEEX|nr:hypothetical protein CEXT_362351 [Caerostris extrusa]
MKVTVYFGNVRVIVPCGKGDILVRDLMDLAITRYKKATGKIMIFSERVQQKPTSLLRTSRNGPKSV